MLGLQSRWGFDVIRETLRTRAVRYIATDTDRLYYLHDEGWMTPDSDTSSAPTRSPG